MRSNEAKMTEDSDGNAKPANPPRDARKCETGQFEHCNFWMKWQPVGESNPSFQVENLAS